jgi:hypothetical protein
MGLLDSLRTRVGYYLDPPLTEPAPRPSTPHNPQMGTLFDPPFKMGVAITTQATGPGGILTCNDPNAATGSYSARCQIQTVAGGQAIVGNQGIYPNDEGQGTSITVPPFYAATVPVAYGQPLYIYLSDTAACNLVWLLAGEEPPIADGPLTQP